MPRLLLFLLGALVLPALSQAEVLRVEIDAREAVLGGKTFGAYGPYEVVRGRLVFGFDPATR
jgi:hypothetical protein